MTRGTRKEGRRHVTEKARINLNYVTVTLCLCQQNALCHFLLDSSVSLQPYFFRFITQSQTALYVWTQAAASTFPTHTHFAGFLSEVIVVIIFHGEAPHRVTAQS